MLPRDFLETLHKIHSTTDSFPPTSAVARLVTRLILLLFPEQTKIHYHSVDKLGEAFIRLERDLTDMLQSMHSHLPDSPSNVSAQFIEKIPEIYHLLRTDVSAILSGDPAATSEYEIVRAYPGFYAVAFYRIAHAFYDLNIPLLPRVLTEFAHSRTGIDIHPSAEIDEYLFIDHGTGIVIGETTVIGRNVKLYQGVTLGALSVSKELASQKRHPTVENDVVIYSGATILGGETVIGHHSIVGGNVWLTHSIKPYTKIYHQEQVLIKG
ncbi:MULTISPECIES: serine O-acetyltransferase [unclassified Siphonobacter]|uniref:serine O-acetyltransferase n=1 Tax=unclassified Siphonobacter TaxID=2635712 RepID=UPI000CC39D45|nr:MULTISPECIES: serine acetyltransferase [unclassified Siphonobacter]MDQ1087336.1 serine O-acetyltransferase [Siphonobacter sp. SORGH_AS_1065]MDR6193489.1 serine O-acetyltransferase [Siphonobacter sp. SORGH_AS_0500]PKK36356.1 serine acetyltransferase [Siphonobacter sp. SORGH_AS_0500]